MIVLHINDPEPENVLGRVIRGEQVTYYFAEDPEMVDGSAAMDELTGVEERTKSKKERTITVDRIKVTTSYGNTFDGDETSQNRMARAILVMDDIEDTLWILANNTPVRVTKAELLEALRLAGDSQSNIWQIP